MKIRFALDSDVSDMSKLGTESYADAYYENDESFRSKILGYQEGCFVADLDGIVGYVISFPYSVGKIFPINTEYNPIENPNCYYIHDLCVSKDFRNKGIAQKLVKTVIQNKKAIGLTAIQGSERFWEGLGFKTFLNIDYCGLPASYMMLITTIS